MHTESESPNETYALNRRWLVTAGLGFVTGVFGHAFTRPASAGHDGTNVFHLGELNKWGGFTQLTNTGQGTALYVFNNDAASATVYSVNSQGPSLFGFSYGGDGVQGFSYNRPGSLNGVRGQAMKPNVSGVYGENTGGGYGVAGRSQATGVYGESTDPYTGHGVLGRGLGTYSVGVRGESNSYAGVMGFSANSIGVYANSAGHYGLYATSSAGTAGYFNGGVFVDGNLTATGAKSAAVPHPDGSQRRLYSVESPESWFEDFGQARLEGGRATVAIDPDFAVLVSSDSYHVFLSPYGDCKGLFVSDRTLAGFVVSELQGGTSSIEFGYRVVAKRKDSPGLRLERVVLAQAATRTELPKPPDLPPPPIQPEPIRQPELMQAQARTKPPEPPNLPLPLIWPEPLKMLPQMNR